MAAYKNPSCICTWRLCDNPVPKTRRSGSVLRPSERKNTLFCGDECKHLWLNENVRIAPKPEPEKAICDQAICDRWLYGKKV